MHTARRQSPSRRTILLSNLFVSDVGPCFAFSVLLVGLAVGALALGSLTSSLWIWTGERNLVAVRKRVYAAVTRKELVWFDTQAGKESEDSTLGAGGLMAKFTK